MDKLAIAKAYAERMETADVESWHILAKESVAQVAKLEQYFAVTYASGQPYRAAKQMFADLDQQKITISTDYLEHPIWTPSENLAFRLVHDVKGHYHGGKNGFNWDGEVRVYKASLKHYSLPAYPALFCEVVGQTASRSVTGKFPPQRIVAFDWDEMRLENGNG